MSSGSPDELDSRDAATVAAVVITVINEEALESERGRCWPSSSEKWLLESSLEWLDDDGDGGRRAHGKDEVCLGRPVPASFLCLFDGKMLRPCHTTTYSTNVCRRMKNSASTLVHAEYVRNKF